MDSKDKTILDYLSNKKRGRLLDAGGGEGKLYKYLKSRFDVTVCDINISKLKEVKYDRVDLNGDLPYKSGFFDYVISAEVIEHIENPHHLIREFRRTLRPGGTLILTTPNIINIFSRIKFLLTGTFFCFSDTERKFEHGHINPMTYFELKDTLERNNMEIIEIKSNEHLKLCGVESTKNIIKRSVSYMTYIILNPLLTPRDKEILKGDIIILVAKKR